VTVAVSDGLVSSDFADAVLSRCKRLVMAATVMTAAIVGFSLGRRLIERSMWPSWNDYAPFSLSTDHFTWHLALGTRLFALGTARALPLI